MASRPSTQACPSPRRGQQKRVQGPFVPPGMVTAPRFQFCLLRRAASPQGHRTTPLSRGRHQGPEGRGLQVEGILSAGLRPCGLDPGQRKAGGLIRTELNSLVTRETSREPCSKRRGEGSRGGTVSRV